MKKEITIGEKYRPAMEITNQDEADAYFEKCVVHNMGFGTSREEAERVEKTNLGYYAGYCDKKTAERVWRLFKCEHPILGRYYPSPQEAFFAGQVHGKKMKEGVE